MHLDGIPNIHARQFCSTAGHLLTLTPLVSLYLYLHFVYFSSLTEGTLGHLAQDSKKLKKAVSSNFYTTRTSYPATTTAHYITQSQESVAPSMRTSSLNSETSSSYSIHHICSSELLQSPALKDVE